jgi:hypothetical protein
VKPLDGELLSTLPAKRLLAYRDRLLSLEESPEESDCYEDEIRGLDPALIWFKSDSRWKDLYDQVRALLAKAEHVS